MSVEENKTIERRFMEEVWTKGNLAAVDELVATNYVDHTPMPDVSPDLQGVKQFATVVRAAFPDWNPTIEDIIAEGDKVVVRFTGRGTHKGEFMGIPPTGKQLTMMAIAIHRIAGGKIVENWLQADMLGMMQQLGVVPTPGQGGS
ncbi:MAG: ester cyclase [Dehalococcoidia bacterium]